jgi:hypothetical protein
MAVARLMLGRGENRQRGEKIFVRNVGMGIKYLKGFGQKKTKRDKEE